MAEYLILKLKGAMQAWGGHTYEDYRPSLAFPTRSGLLGLLGACLGIKRSQLDKQQALDKSFRFAVRADKRELTTKKLVDFHTVEGVVKIDGSTTDYPVVTRREYLLDAEFTIAIEFLPGATYNLATIKQALAKPIFTPFLGRRSCLLSRPLFEAQLTSNTLEEALSQIEPKVGVIYSEIPTFDNKVLIVRDKPLLNGKRQFHDRKVYVKH